MLIKSGLDHKSRWNLDDTDGDDPNLKFENSCTVPGSVRDFLKAHSTKVHLLHPRLVPVAKQIPRKLVGTITVSQKTTIKPPPFTEFDGEDYIPEPETHTIEYSVNVLQVESAALIELPPIDIELCGTFAKNLVPLLDEATVYTPGQVYGDGSIGTMSTSTCAEKSPASLPLVDPPSFIQGVTAALASNAQRLGKKVTVVLVHADGPAGHEVMHQYDVASIQHMLLRALGVSNVQAEPDISALYL